MDILDLGNVFMPLDLTEAMNEEDFFGWPWPIPTPDACPYNYT